MESRKMHCKFTIALLLAFVSSVGQTTVPNTTTFSLQNVVDVVGGTSLNAAFTNSVDAYFDPAYKGSKNSLLNFRNYKKSDVDVYSQSASETGSTSASVSYSISSTNYYLTDWAILCYTSGMSYVGRLDGSASGTSASISESFTGLSAGSTYKFYCYGVDASGNTDQEWTNEITTESSCSASLSISSACSEPDCTPYYGSGSGTVDCNGAYSYSYTFNPSANYDGAVATIYNASNQYVSTESVNTQTKTTTQCSGSGTFSTTIGNGYTVTIYFVKYQ